MLFVISFLCWPICLQHAQQQDANLHAQHAIVLHCSQVMACMVVAVMSACRNMLHAGTQACHVDP